MMGLLIYRDSLKNRQCLYSFPQLAPAFTSVVKFHFSMLSNL